MANLHLQSLCTMNNARNIGRTLLVSALLAAAVGCGGGGAAGKGDTTTPANAAKDPQGNVVRSGSGVAVSKEAEASWRDALAEFEAAEKSGWNASSCEAVSDSFKSANKEQKGKF